MQTPKRLLLLAALVLGALTGHSHAIELGLPARCVVGTDCFFQQFPDMDPGAGTIDPFCGTASYDGHDGTDLRILSMADVERGVAVLAMADGQVLRLRDGEPDRMVRTERDRQEVASKECGNGVLIDHGGGMEVQYCHMRQGSIAVAAGDTVRRGDVIGEIGASGFAQFPHVHVTVRQDREAIDPSTGRKLSEGCSDGSDLTPLFAPQIVASSGRGEAELIAMGLAGDVVEHDALAEKGPPQPASSNSNAIVAWGWLIKLRKDDRVRIRLTGPDGRILAEQATEPMDRTKASYSAYAGKRGSPPPGEYAVSVALVRGGQTVLERIATYTVDSR
jgi:hypothetical protein